MPKNLALIGTPVGGITPEMEMKRIQAELAQRKSSIARLKLDLEDLRTVQAPQLEALILMHENDIRFLTKQQNDAKVIDVTPKKEG
jgi:hypothetical protein